MPQTIYLILQTLIFFGLKRSTVQAWCIIQSGHNNQYRNEWMNEPSYSGDELLYHIGLEMWKQKATFRKEWFFKIHRIGQWCCIKNDFLTCRVVWCLCRRVSLMWETSILEMMRHYVCKCSHIVQKKNKIILACMYVYRQGRRSKWWNVDSWWIWIRKFFVMSLQFFFKFENFQSMLLFLNF